MRALFMLVAVTAAVLLVQGDRGWPRFVVAVGVTFGCLWVLAADWRRGGEL